jgi:aryl-alcohol dehydrogenase-like predicted oxidoreductase
VKLRTLGTSNLALSRIGLGTWAIGGGDWVLGWGPQHDEESVATIRRAIANGVNWIDTAPAYGLGRAETIVARALRGISPRERPYLFTKCGLVWDELGNIQHDLSARSIRSQAEASLRRLRVEHLDVYQIGWPAWLAHGSKPLAGSLDEAWETMAALQLEGKVGCIGLSHCHPGDLARLQRIATITSLLAPYSLLRREIEDRLLPFCRREQIGVVACSALGAGLLTGRMTAERACSLPCNDWRRRHSFVQELALTGVSTIVERLRGVAARHDRTPGAVAIAWALRHPEITAVAVGARRPWQVDEIVHAASLSLTPQDVDDLEHALTLTRR